jgi:hypothetical protein
LIDYLAMLFPEWLRTVGLGLVPHTKRNATKCGVCAEIEAQFVAVNFHRARAEDFPQLFSKKSMFPLDKV